VKPEADVGALQIGELSRRTGVSEHVLRAWESRYGLLSPMRSPGGFRLYSARDEQRVRRMQFHMARGLRAAEAARATIRERPTPGSLSVDDRGSDETGRRDLQALAAELRTALDALDEPAAQAVLDRLMSDYTLATTLRDVVVPYLRQLGNRWANGELTIIQEHFASNVIRGRLAGLARGWGDGDGPRAVLACPPGELHDVALLIFGIVLNRRGWRVEFFGANTPVAEVIDGALRSPPDLIVVAATVPERLTAISADLAHLAAVAPLALAGAGASPAAADAVGAELLTGDPVTAAQQQPHRQPVLDRARRRPTASPNRTRQ
jgi:MerR family transcriptional regulator, light-induced transcriptional regulator